MDDADTELERGVGNKNRERKETGGWDLLVVEGRDRARVGSRPSLVIYFLFLSGRKVHKNMLHALLSILEDEGVGGLYRGLGPSCMKLVPAAGISFMCYEACKKILIEEEDE